MWQADFDCAAAGVFGTVGTGYLRDTGKIKYMEYTEPVAAPWNEKLHRVIFSINVRFND